MTWAILKSVAKAAQGTKSLGLILHFLAYAFSGPLTEFHLFPKLAPELRLKIWRVHIEMTSRRLIELENEDTRCKKGEMCRLLRTYMPQRDWSDWAMPEHYYRREERRVGKSVDQV